MSGALDYIQENREKLLLVAYFVLILGLASPLSEMLGSAWRQSSLVRETIRLRLLVGADLETFSIVVFGLYLGLLVLMTIDPKKRWQAFLLWFGTIVGLLALQSLGLFLPNVDLIGHFPILLGGIGLGLVVGGGQKLLELQNLAAIEFRRASRALFILMAAFTVIGFLELHIQYPDLISVSADGIAVESIQSPKFGLNDEGIVQDLVVSGLFIVTLRQFVQYDAEKRFFILGPRASGKSLFLIGSYLEALERTHDDGSATPLNPSQDLMSMLEALDRQDSEWIVEATGRGELKGLRFQYVHGSVFPTNVQLSAYDYAGEYLTRIPDGLTGAIDPDEMDTTLRRLVEGIQIADSLMLVVDVERFINNEPLEISEYFSILQATGSKDVLIIATKADVLADDFEDERGLDAHLYFDEFKEYVNTRLRQSENVDSLLTEAGGEIHPVYYQTKVNENGNRVPMRDDSGSVMTVGYDDLLNEIGRM
jgi:hypothetical protein